MFNVGDVINVNYVITGMASAQGGMGTVVFAQHLKTGQKVAVKYCNSSDEEIRKRFRREVKLLEKYQESTCVVRVVYFDLLNDPPMFFMELADGDLSKAGAKVQDSFSKQEELFSSMVKCVAELHSQGDCHRDIKPANFCASEKESLYQISAWRRIFQWRRV